MNIDQIINDHVIERFLPIPEMFIGERLTGEEKAKEPPKISRTNQLSDGIGAALKTISPVLTSQRVSRGDEHIGIGNKMITEINQRRKGWV